VQELLSRWMEVAEMPYIEGTLQLCQRLGWHLHLGPLPTLFKATCVLLSRSSNAGLPVAVAALM
jgi:hypothetical protein